MSESRESPLLHGERYESQLSVRTENLPRTLQITKHAGNMEVRVTRKLGEEYSQFMVRHRRTTLGGCWGGALLFRCLQPNDKRLD